MPLDPSKWLALLEAYLDTASEEKIQAAEEGGLALWPYLLDRGGRLAPQWTGESSTYRVYARHPPVQGIPKPLRAAVSEPKRVVISCDWRASHLHVLAEGSGDVVLQRDLQTDAYAVLSREVGHPRDLVKVATLATLNGAGASRIGEILGGTIRDGTLFQRHLSARWPVALAFLEGLKKRDTLRISTGDLLLPPTPDKAPAYWLQAEEAHWLRQVLAEEPPSGLELILALHDETVWLSDPDRVNIHVRWVEALMGKFAPVRIGFGSSWGTLGDGGVGADRPVTPAAIIHQTVRALKADAAKALQDPFGIQYLGGKDPDRLAALMAVMEVRGDKAVVKALRALGKQGRRSLARAKALATASKEEVEDLGLPLFKRGDQLELGQHLARSIAPQGRAKTTPEGVRVYSEETGAWSLLDPKVLEGRALIYGKSFVEGKQGAVVPIFLSAAAVSGIAKIAELELQDLTWAPSEGVLAFENGTLDEEGELHAHDPDNRVLSEHVFRGEYDPEAKAEEWDRYLRGVFLPDDDAAEKISFLQEYLGACLFGRATKYQRHPMLWGPSASNGKSVFIKTVREIFPPGSLASSPPQSWSKEFGKSALLHCRMNLITETPDRDIVDSGPVKAIMTGDPLEINIKYRDPITYAPVAGHVFAANALPKVTDRSDGFFRRFVMIRFNRVFKDGVDADTTLPDRLKEEIPGIIAWAVRGYQRLRERGHLVPPPSHEEAITVWREESSSELSFTQSQVEPAPDGKMVTSQSVYDAYRLFCNDQGLYPVSQNKLGRALVEAGYPRHRGAQGRGFILRVKKSR